MKDFFEDCCGVLDYAVVALILIVAVIAIAAIYFTIFFFLAWGCEWALTHFVSINEEIYWTGAGLVALLGLIIGVRVKSD